MNSLPNDPVNAPRTSANDRREDDMREAARAPRRGQDGPIGFGAVMRTVGKQRAGGNQHGAAGSGARQHRGAAHTGTHQQRGMHAAAGEHGTAHAGSAHDAAAAAHPRVAGGHGHEHAGEPASVHHHAPAEHPGSDTSAAAADARWVAHVAGDVAAAPSPSGSEASSDASGSSAAATSATATRAAQAQALAGANGAMTPARAMALIEDVARSLDRDNGSRELHIRLEPAHLGPLVVQLSVDQRGIRARIATRTNEAAKILGTGTAQLQARLLQLGYATATVDVERDEDAVDAVSAI